MNMFKGEVFIKIQPATPLQVGSEFKFKAKDIYKSEWVSHYKW